MKNRNTILIYVAKIEGVTGENYVIQNSIDYSFYHCIPTKLPDIEITKQATKFFVELFDGIKNKLQNHVEKFQFKLVFNDEDSVIGFALYRSIEGGFNKKSFQRVEEVELKKPINSKEKRMFLNAVRRIPVYK